MGKFCINCGIQLNEGARFCTNCGAPVAAQSTPVLKREEAPGPAAPQQIGYGYGLPKAPPMPQSNNKGLKGQKTGKKGRSGNVLCVFLSVLFLVESAAVALFGWPGFAVGGEHEVKFTEIKVEKGMAKTESVSVDLKNNGDIQSLGIAKTAKGSKEEGTVSDTYEFAFDTIPEESIKIYMPAKDDLKLADNEMLYLDVGVSVTSEGGEEFMFHDFIKADIEDNMLTAEITPSAYASPEDTVYTRATGIAKRTHTDKFRFNAVYSTKEGKESPGRHFKLIFDSVLGKSSLSDEDISELLSKMEQVYDQMAAFGFDMSARTAWPMEVYVKRFSQSKDEDPIDGLYVSKLWGINYSHMELNRNLFTDFQPHNIIKVFAHEFTHFLQNCKVSFGVGMELDWLNESTAVFFEDYFGDSNDYGARYLDVFDGIYPPSDSASAGYARPSLISYWAAEKDWLGGIDSQSGKNKMSGLIELYSSGGYIREGLWHNWITACIGNPSKYAVDFYTKVLLCHESVWGDKVEIKPYTMHSYITGPVKKKSFTDRVKIFFGRYKEMDLSVEIKDKFSEMKLLGEEISSEKGQSLKVSVPAYGAQVVALSMTQGEQKILEDDASISISDDGSAELVLFKIRGKEVETINGGNPSAPDFVNNLKAKICYLVLVVNTTNKAISTELNVKIDGGVDLDKLKALYNGTWSSADDYKDSVVFEVVSTGALKYKHSHMDKFDTFNMEPSPDGTRLGLSASVGVMSMGNIYLDTGTGILTWVRTNGEKRLYSKGSR